MKLLGCRWALVLLPGLLLGCSWAALELLLGSKPVVEDGDGRMPPRGRVLNSAYGHIALKTTLG